MKTAIAKALDVAWLLFVASLLIRLMLRVDAATVQDLPMAIAVCPIAAAAVWAAGLWRARVTAAG